jgi:2-keto-4-pentenoate hydratase/2-oxohepta-3-ene-1,7-dioic acid hydratase in catechol pathway
MKLVRFGAKGEERPGLLKNGDKIVDLKKLFPDIPDIGEEFFRGGWLEKVSGVDEPGQKTDERIGCPVGRPSKIICLGKNYAEHAKEGGFDSPEKPILFCKSPNTLNGPFDPVYLPESSGQVDWEVELAVVIGKEGKRIKRENAYDFIAGYAVMNDVSGRQAQFSDSQWFRGKSFDTFAPLGPVIVTKDEIKDVRNLRLTCMVDGVIMQDGNTKDMIFDIPFIIEYVSRDITLTPGDIISTGTPSGVGIFRNPPVTLSHGSIVECGIEKIGTIRNRFLDEKQET